MFNRDQWLEHVNYVNDPRNNVRNTHLEPDENTMTVRWTRMDEDENETIIEFPARFEVCDLCQGKGTHVNPSIDAGGLSDDDEFWYDDIDSETGESRYRRGDYNIPCNCCKGRRVMLVIDRARVEGQSELVALLDKYDEYMADEAAYEAECRAEHRMGC